MEIQTAWPVKRAGLVDKKHPKLSVRAQCKILGVAHSVLNYKSVEERAEGLMIARISTKDPNVGSRRFRRLDLVLRGMQ